MKWRAWLGGCVIAAVVTMNLSPRLTAQAPTFGDLTVGGPDDVDVVLPASVDPSTCVKTVMLVTSGQPTYSSGGRPVTASETYVALSMNGSPVRSVKGYFYCRGCGIAPFEWSVETARRVSLSPAHLGAVVLTGRIDEFDHADEAANMQLEVSYQPAWEDEFKHPQGLGQALIVEVVTVFQIGTAMIRQDGTFAIALPDFARDPVISGFRTFGTFYLYATEVHPASRVRRVWDVSPELGKRWTLTVADHYPTLALHAVMRQLR